MPELRWTLLLNTEFFNGLLGVTISRSRRGFRSEEVRAVELYALHFAQAFRIHQSRTDEESLESGAGASNLAPNGVLLSNGDGQIVRATYDSSNLLAQYFPASRRTPGVLPPKLTARIKALRSSAQERIGTSSVLYQVQGSSKLRIEFLHQGRFDRWYLRLTAMDSAQAQRMQAQGLSPRLKSVLTWLLTGLSEKEIAAKLELTKSTTHGYIKDVYRSVGVHSRSELMALWVRRDSQP